jgi:hypothetical protein
MTLEFQNSAVNINLTTIETIATKPILLLYEGGNETDSIDVMIPKQNFYECIDLYQYCTLSVELILLKNFSFYLW